MFVYNPMTTECKIDINEEPVSDSTFNPPEDDPVDGPNICCICLDAMNECIYVYVACNHKIHNECYKVYSGLHKATTCPMCRTKDVVENDDEDIIPIVYILNTMNRRSSRVHPAEVTVRPDCRKCIIVTSIMVTWLWILLMITLFAVKPL